MDNTELENQKTSKIKAFFDFFEPSKFERKKKNFIFYSRVPTEVAAYRLSLWWQKTSSWLFGKTGLKIEETLTYKHLRGISDYHHCDARNKASQFSTQELHQK